MSAPPAAMCCRSPFGQQRWLCFSEGSESCMSPVEVISNEDLSQISGVIGQNLKDPEGVGTSKRRLQDLVRTFAQDVAAGTGIEVEAWGIEWKGNAESSSVGRREARFRMDRRLSRVEVWDAQVANAVGPLLAVPLAEVDTLEKGFLGHAGEFGEDSAALAIRRREGDLGLVFDSLETRNVAFLCLRIFKMSVANIDDEILSFQSQSRESKGGDTPLET